MYQVNVGQRKVQELMFVRPILLSLSKLLHLLRRGRWVSDLGDQVCGGCFGNAIDEDAHKRDSDQDVESQTETKQNSLAAAEPVSLLILCKVNTSEVWLKQLSHQASGREVALEKDYQVPSREENSRTEDDRSRSQAHSVVEGVKTGRGQDKSADIWCV